MNEGHGDRVAFHWHGEEGEQRALTYPKALITTDGARRRGKTAPIKQAVDEVISGLDSLSTVVVVRSTSTPCDMRDGRDVWYDELLAAAEPECPGPPRSGPP